MDLAHTPTSMSMLPPHYQGVLGTRRRSVSQIDITVEPGSDDARDIEIADMVRDWLDRDELSDLLRQGRRQHDQLSVLHGEASERALGAST